MQRFHFQVVAGEGRMHSRRMLRVRLLQKSAGAGGAIKEKRKGLTSVPFPWSDRAGPTRWRIAQARLAALGFSDTERAELLDDLWSQLGKRGVLSAERSKAPHRETQQDIDGRHAKERAAEVERDIQWGRACTECGMPVDAGDAVTKVARGRLDVLRDFRQEAYGVFHSACFDKATGGTTKTAAVGC